MYAPHWECVINNYNMEDLTPSFHQVHWLFLGLREKGEEGEVNKRMEDRKEKVIVLYCLDMYSDIRCHMMVIIFSR